jgi:hypothetical protein
MSKNLKKEADKNWKRLEKSWHPKIKLWDGTTVHASLDTLLMQDIALKLKVMGFDAEHKAWWSFEDLHNDKLAFVTHTRRLGSINPYSVSQRDAEKWQIDMYSGKLPHNVAMSVAAHGHTTRGSIDDDPFRIVNVPCWCTFLEYPKANANFAHYQTDIGAYFIIVTKEGRIRVQKWLYKPFVYDHNEKKIYEAGDIDSKKYVEEGNGHVDIEEYFKVMCKDAKFLVAVVADFHVGEVAAIAPEKYTYNGQEFEVHQTLASQRLLQYWRNFAKVCKLLKPNEIWVVGDTCCGTQIFEKTRRSISQNLEEQKAMFVELFKELL